MIISGYACSDDDSLVPEMIVSKDKIVLSKDGDLEFFHIKTNLEWSISSSKTWCSVEPSSGKGIGTIKIAVSASENTTTDIRNAVLSIKTKDESFVKTMEVEQLQRDLLVIETKEYDVKAEGGNIIINVQTSGSYNVAVDKDWIQKSAVVESVSDLSVVFTVSENATIFKRSGSITFSIGDLSETVMIRQAAADLYVEADKTGVESDATALAKKMKIGWNLGNTLEATDGFTASETLWGNPVTSKKLIDAVKAAGFNTVRIPCAWNAYIEDESTYKIKDVWLARVKEVVDYCMDNGMYAIINIHWDGGWLEENPTYDKKEEVNEKQKALWQQIAVYFRDYNEQLLFAGTNEVHAGYTEPTSENISVQLSYNQTFVDAVRSTGGKNTWRNLIVQSYNTNIDYAVKYLKMPTDEVVNRVMVEVHYYDPYEFCLREENSVFLWGKDFKGEGTISWGQEAWADEQFEKLRRNFVDNGIPVLLGEYCVMLRSSLGAADYENHIKSRNYYLNYITKAAVKNGVIPIYWDSGHTGDKASGLFDRLTGEQVHVDAIQAIMGSGV